MPLVLDGTNGVSGVDGTASNPAIEGTDSNTGIFYPAADTVAIGTGGTERLRVDSSGNVGVGTSSPATLIDSRINQNNTYSATGLSATASTALTLKNNTTAGAVNNFVALRFDPNDVFARAEICAVYDATNASALTFKTEPNGGDPTERMRIDSSGNVGIGTSSPGSILAVSAASPTITLTATTTTGTTIGNKNNRLALLSDSSTVGNGGEIVFGATDTNVDRWGAISGAIQTNSGSGATGDILFATKASDAATSLTERMRITSTGEFELQSTTANGAYVRSGARITLASNATINITNATAGACLVLVYNAGDGAGAVFFANYLSTAVKVAGDGAATDTGTTFALYKNASSHVTTIRNRYATSQTFSIAVYSAEARI